MFSCLQNMHLNTPRIFTWLPCMVTTTKVVISKHLMKQYPLVMEPRKDWKWKFDPRKSNFRCYEMNTPY